MTPLLKGILTGLCASLFFTPIGGIVIGFMAYKMALNEEKKNERD